MGSLSRVLCQHHCSCSLGLSRRTNRATRTHDGGSDARVCCSVTDRQGHRQQDPGQQGDSGLGGAALAVTLSVLLSLD